MEITEQEKRRFDADPARFIEETVKTHILTSPMNRLKSFNDSPIWEEPLVGFANGDDPLFQQYKQIIGEFCLTPREALSKQRQVKGISASYDGPVSVIAWILPIARDTRLSMHQETRVGSLRWNHTRWHGEDLNMEMSQHLVSLLESLGIEAVAPMQSEFRKITETPKGMASNWSFRHMAYACGLGTFSLNDGLITPRGIAQRCNAIAAGIALPASPRPYPDHLANCLHYRGIACAKCAQRCPAGAISEKGHDKAKCRAYLNQGKAILKELGREEGYIGMYSGCGLCQTKVPCEDRIPSG